MRRRTEHIRLVRAAVALSLMLVLSLGGVAMAAEQAPAPAPSGFVGWLSNPVPESLPFRLTGEVDLGAQKLEGNRNSPNFRTYRVIEEGFVANRFRLGLETKDRRWFSDFQGLNIGKDDQNYRVSLGQYGRYRLDFEWDQIPHLYAQGAHSAFVRSEGGQYGFPSAISAAVQAAAAAAKPGILRPAVNGSTVFDIKTRNDTAKGGLWWSPRPEWDLQLTYDHTRRAGTRPVGAGFGSPGGSVVELPEPIEWQTDQLAATVGYSTAAWQLQGGYRLSIFGNDIKTMTYDNPLFATAAGANSNVGRAVLAPDNQSHNLFLAGGVNLPMATRLSAKVAYAWNRQDDQFFTHTVNPLLAGDPRLRLYAPSLRGDVRNLLVNATGTTRPIRDVTVTGTYRFYGNDNRTLQQTFPAHVVRDAGAAVVVEPRFSTVHDYQKQNGDLDVAWRVLRPVTLRAGFGWERWDRPETREVGRTDEYSGKFGLNYRPFSWLDIGAKYIRSWKRIDEYNTFAHLGHTLIEEEVADAARTSQSPLLRKYDEAARDRHKAELALRLFPVEALEVGLTFGYTQDRYPFSYLGLLEDKGWSGAIDITYTPVTWLTLRGNYTREGYHSRQKSRSRPVTGTTVGDFVGFEWYSNNVDMYDTVGAGTVIRLIPDRLNLEGDYTYQLSIARLDSGNPFPVQCTPTVPGNTCTAGTITTARAASFPDDRFSLHRIGGLIRFYLLRNLALRAGYTYERFRVSYWQTDFIQPVNTVPPISTSQTDVFLGVRPFRSYEAHIIGGGLTYEF